MNWLRRSLLARRDTERVPAQPEAGSDVAMALELERLRRENLQLQATLASRRPRRKTTSRPAEANPSSEHYKISSRDSAEDSDSSAHLGWWYTNSGDERDRRVAPVEADS